MEFNRDLTRKLLYALKYSNQITVHSLAILREDTNSSDIVFYDNKNRQFTIFLSGDIVLIMLNGDIIYEFEFRSFINIEHFICDLSMAICKTYYYIY